MQVQVVSLSSRNIGADINLWLSVLFYTCFDNYFDWWLWPVQISIDLLLVMFPF